MASVKQTRANHRNGALSRGPLTAEGKRIAAANPTRHGLRASGEVLVPGEDRDEYAAFVERMREDIGPMGQVEELLAERVISLGWRLRRVPRVEAELLRWHHLEERLERARAEAACYTAFEEDPDLPDEEVEVVVAHPRLHARATRVIATVAHAQDEGTTLGRAFRRASGSTDQLALVERYERALQRSWIQCLHELQRLQAARQGAQVLPPVAVDVQVSSGDG